MSTRTQAKALGEGFKAVLARSADREAASVPLILYHGLEPQPLADLLHQVQAMILNQGASLVPAPPASMDLRKSQAHIERLVSEKKELAKQLSAIQKQIDNGRGMAPAGAEWISLTVAAKRLHKSYSTLWRAHADGRLTTRVIGGKSRDQLVCDPATYRAKGRGKCGS